MDAFSHVKNKIDGLLSGQNKPVILGLSGGQGSGKSYVCKKLQAHYGERCAVLGVDDFYLTKAERTQKAQEISPLFLTRGVPGTHDISHLIQMVERLCSSNTLYPLSLPVFDKLADDRYGDKAHIIYQAPEIIVVEGWCVGALPAPDFVNGDAKNRIEMQDGADKWRAHQYDVLNGSYQILWDMMDGFVHMQAPDFDVIKTWKAEQLANDKGLGIEWLSQEDKDWVSDFVQYYERITTDMMKGHRMDGLVVRLNSNRDVCDVIG